MHHVSNITIPFLKLAEVLGLPESTTIVGVKEHTEGTHFVVRVVADVMPADCVLGPEDSLQKIGQAYQASPGMALGGEAVVEGVVEPEEAVVAEPVEDDTPLGEIIAPTVVS